jgi:hypothetical protein
MCRLNFKQRIALGLGLLIFAASFLYPPWAARLWTMDDSGTMTADLPALTTYDWLFRPPKSPLSIRMFGREVTSEWTYQLDIARLVIQWVLIGISTVGLLWMLQTNDAQT